MSYYSRRNVICQIGGPREPRLRPRFVAPYRARESPGNRPLRTAPDRFGTTHWIFRGLSLTLPGQSPGLVNSTVCARTGRIYWPTAPAGAIGSPARSSVRSTLVRVGRRQLRSIRSIPRRSVHSSDGASTARRRSASTRTWFPGSCRRPAMRTYSRPSITFSRR